MRNTRNYLVVCLVAFVVAHFCAGHLSAGDRAIESEGMPTIEIVKLPAEGGIREEIPKAYKSRFAKWKSDLLSTDFGRRQWEMWANASHVIVTIRVLEERGKGAVSGRVIVGRAAVF